MLRDRKGLCCRPGRRGRRLTHIVSRVRLCAVINLYPYGWLRKITLRIRPPLEPMLLTHPNEGCAKYKRCADFHPASQLHRRHDPGMYRAQFYILRTQLQSSSSRTVRDYSNAKRDGSRRNEKQIRGRSLSKDDVAQFDPD